MTTPDAPVLLVTGSQGQVGFELCRSLAPLGRVVPLDRQACDLANPAALREAVRACRPDVIVNAAAYTAVDRAEQEPDQAYAVNATGVSVLAGVAAERDCLLIHYSTDHVFDGVQHRPYTEDDVPNPMSAYGKSKLAGEAAIVDAGASALVLRTAWVFAPRRDNFARTILKRGIAGEPLRVVNDHFGSPTPAALVADVTAQMLGRAAGAADFRAEARRIAGLYHVTASGSASRHEYARAILQYAAARGVRLGTGPDDLEAVAAGAYPLPAPRPANGCLDTSRLRHAFGLHLPPWQDGLHHMLDQILC